MVGFASGEIPRIALNLPLLKRSSIVGVNWAGHVAANPSAGGELMSRLVSWVSAGKIHPKSSGVFRFEEAGAVLQSLLDRRSIGKPVIRVSG